MSIKLMSAIFETEFRDLQMPETDKDGKTRHAKASSMKLVLLALADHANDEGESSYPGFSKLEIKTGLSRQGLADVLSALKYNGLVFVDTAPSRLGTNNYTLSLECYPKLTGSGDIKLLVKPLDQSSHLTSASQVTLPEVVKSLDHNHPLTIHKPSLSEKEIEEANKVTDKHLLMANFSGAKREARLASIQSYLGETFRRNTETKEWLAFAKYIDSEFRSKGWDVKVFIKWLLGQKDYNPQFWPVKKMIEFYPSAFTPHITTNLVQEKTELQLFMEAQEAQKAQEAQNAK